MCIKPTPRNTPPEKQLAIDRTVSEFFSFFSFVGMRPPRKQTISSVHMDAILSSKDVVELDIFCCTLTDARAAAMLNSKAHRRTAKLAQVQGRKSDSAL